MRCLIVVVVVVAAAAAADFVAAAAADFVAAVGSFADYCAYHCPLLHSYELKLIIKFSFLSHLNLETTHLNPCKTFPFPSSVATEALALQYFVVVTEGSIAVELEA
jgi:hypothetical protein